MKFLSCILALLTCSLPAVNISAQEISREILAQAAPKTNTAPRSPSGYKIGPGDNIEIKVLGETQFDGTYTVDEDGKIVLAFVNKPIQAGCRTEREIKEDVAGALGKYLKNPQFSLRVVQKNTAPAVVYGEVRMPQQVEMKRRVRLLELLSFSGGWTDKAGGTVQVFRTQPILCPEAGEEFEPQPLADGSNVPFRVYKLSELSSGKNEANPIIRPGDVVTVQKAPPVFVVGEVRNPPPPDTLTIPERGLMLTDAINSSGGLTRDAKKKDVKIYRLKPGSPNREIIAVNLDLIKKQKQPDIALQPYDVIEVEKAPKSIGDYLKDYLTGGLSAFTNTLPVRAMY
ncbi:MAG TPA: polysaccharide biosynthesis/export family protein [Pyrinomonadaceae bacterium]|jgi:polysaccharide export outer membrane protein